MKDLELMHQYSTSTCLTMTDVKANLPIWQTDIPKLAFKHEFLTHGLLALAALHMAQIESAEDSANNVIPTPNDGRSSQSPRKTPPSVQMKLGDIARNHQSAALSAYIPLLQHINQENSTALFAFSAILGATSFAFLQHSLPEEHSSHEFVKAVIDIFELLVGSTVIAIEGRQWLKTGKFANLLVPHPFLEREISDCSPDAKTSLKAVIDCVRPVTPSLSDVGNSNELWPIYVISAEQLGALFPSTTDQRVAMEKVVGWPALAGSKLIAQLKMFDPVALIILAHYGAALHVNDHIWYLKGLGNRLVKAIFEIVDEQWQQYLSWPLHRTTL